ncbi:MAG: zinc dependent phospholipase C family protein [Candidatus Eremiobacteraeota bacterium]|nr:zinc dependent phospholipase C family protein [Candidatus Eremiobacteraeota bacterium]
MKNFVFIAVLIVVLMTGQAWSAGPMGHFLLSQETINGIRNGSIPAPPELKAALEHPEAQKAFAGGSVGPDICEETKASHYRNTSDLANQMIADARANLKAAAAEKNQNKFSQAQRELAFAYGWLSHCGTDLNIHPYVNGVAGDTYRYNNPGQKAIHAAQESQFTAYLRSINSAKYDTSIPYEFLSRHTGISVINLREDNKKIIIKTMAEIKAAGLVTLTDKMKSIWGKIREASLADTAGFIENPKSMGNWDLDCGKITTEEFEKLRDLAIKANGGQLPPNWGRQYMEWYGQTRNLSADQKLSALKSLVGVSSNLGGKTETTGSTTPQPLTCSIDGPLVAEVGDESIYEAVVNGGTGSFSVEWYLNGKNTAADGKKISITWVKPGDSLVKTIITDKKTRVKRERSVTVTVKPGPLSIKLDGPQKARVGEKSSYSVSIKGGAEPYTIQWTLEGVRQETASTTVASTWVKPGNQVLEVTVTDQGKTSKKDRISIDVAGDKFDAAVSGPATASVGETSTFSVAAKGGVPPYTYQWNLNGTNTNRTESAITLTWQDPGTVTWQNPGTARLDIKVSDQAGASKTFNRTISINPSGGSVAPPVQTAAPAQPPQEIWHINANGHGGTIDFQKATVHFGSEGLEKITDIVFDPGSGRVAFTRPDKRQQFTGTISGNKMQGTFTSDGSSYQWEASRR